MDGDRTSVTSGEKHSIGSSVSVVDASFSRNVYAIMQSIDRRKRRESMPVAFVNCSLRLTC